MPSLLSPPVLVRRRYDDLTPHIDTTGTYCLNEQSAHPHANLFNPDERFVLRSDADEQLLLHVPFKEIVKVYSVTIKAAPGVSMPTSVKVFVNLPTLGFDEAEDTKPAQAIDLKPEDLEAGNPILLRFVKFQAVNNLHRA